MSTDIRISDTFTSREFADTDHPVNHWFQATPVERERMINSPDIIGITFITPDEKVRVLHLPRVMMDFITKVNTIEGVIGNYVNKASTMALDLRVLRNVLVQTIESFSEVEGIPAIADSLSTHTNIGVITKLYDPEGQLVKVPLSIPLIAGHTIMEGHISLPATFESLKAYHPLGHVWASAISGAIYSQSQGQNVQEILGAITTDPTFVLGGVMCSDLIIPIEDETVTSPAMRELTDIRNRLAPNKTISAVDPNFQLDMADPTDNDNVTTATAKRLKATATLHALKIFGLRVVTDPMTNAQKVELPTIKESYLELFAASSTAQITQNFCTAYELHAEERADSRDYLLRATELQFLAPMSCNQLINMRWKLSPLDEHVHMLDKQLSVYNFLPPPLIGSDAEYNKLVQNSITNYFEEELNQSSKWKQKISTSGFTKGRQGAMEDVLAMYANLDCFTSFVFDYKEDQAEDYPLVAVCIREYADFITSKKFKNWCGKYISAAPWLPHSVLVLTHSFFTELGKVVCNPANILAIKKGQDLNPAIFKSTFRQHMKVLQQLEDGISRSSLGAFLSPPRSFDEVKKAEPEIEDKSNKRQRVVDKISYSSQNKLGWLLNTGPKDVLPWFSKFHGKAGICRPFALVGYTCPHGANCKLRHVTQRQLTTDEVASFSSFIERDRSNLAWKVSPAPAQNAETSAGD